MRSKNYWQKQAPFDLPRRVAKKLDQSVEKQGGDAREDGPVKFLWVFPNKSGKGPGEAGNDNQGLLSFDEWLNVLDESSALGADWLVVHVGESFASFPDIWKLCAWAQEHYDLKVGLHLTSAALGEDDLEQLSRLKLEYTYILAKESVLDSLQFLKSTGIQLRNAELNPEERGTLCEQPKSIVCVGSNGSLYTCGLVVGQDEYCLGDVRAEKLDCVMHNTALPHVVTNEQNFPADGCDGCPPIMAKRLSGFLTN